MKKRSVSMIIAVISLFSIIPYAWAWDVVYSASTNQLPTSAAPAWGIETYNNPVPSVESGVLRIQNSGAGYTRYNRDSAISAGVPVTLESRMYITESSSGSTELSIQLPNAYCEIIVYPDRVITKEWGVGIHTYYDDFTTYRTIRMAYNGSNHAYAWVDNKPVFSWIPAGGGQDGINFGTHMNSGASDSYWQYVAYSKAFVPVPEPSSILALGCPLASLVGFAFKRKGR